MRVSEREIEREGTICVNMWLFSYLTRLFESMVFSSKHTQMCGTPGVGDDVLIRNRDNTSLQVVLVLSIKKCLQMHLNAYSLKRLCIGS